MRDYLAKIAAQRHPNQPFADGPAAGTPALFLNASIVPDVRYAERFRKLATEARPFVATAGGQGLRRVPSRRRHRSPPLSAENVTPWLLELKLPLLEEEYFRTLDHQFEVIKYLEPLFAGNIAHRIRTGSYREVKPGVFAAENVSHRRHGGVPHAAMGPWCSSGTSRRSTSPISWAPCTWARGPASSNARP